jgi:hypothetical protein
MWPSGGPEMVGWLRDQVEGGARRRLLGGDRGKSFSGEQGVLSGQHIGV